MSTESGCSRGERRDATDRVSKFVYPVLDDGAEYVSRSFPRDGNSSVTRAAVFPQVHARLGNGRMELREILVQQNGIASANGGSESDVSFERHNRQRDGADRMEDHYQTRIGDSRGHCGSREETPANRAVERESESGSGHK